MYGKNIKQGDDVKRNNESETVSTAGLKDKGPHKAKKPLKHNRLKRRRVKTVRTKAGITREVPLRDGGREGDKHKEE